ncbi:intraflagellar transport protein 74 homolog isoform X1 [Pectinophora gossypiella]|uniref:intraflagellar transport protein 74 homolog isoform X1 n=1 Tax=Pectinophora gossypiella TaxID=13191 RepID=UPI00214EE3EF|nr:intraflagellar transport protein 74 homolog isoform X1 [Pectinophora gossypiella]
MDYSESSASERSSGVRRSDITRPVSRRGFRECTHSGSAVSRSGSMRPTSAYRGGTTSRMSTAGFGPAPPTASRQPTAMTGFSMIDRPITQQGLSGLRTGTARGFRTRQLQDKRYWEEVMQVKVREMKAEIARLSEQADAGEREKSAKKHYEKRVRELAQELTDLQGRLADYNTAIRIVNGEATKQSVEEQTKELEASNKKMQEEVEQVFLEKQRKENQLRQLREQMDKEQSTLTQLLQEMTPEQKDQYNELERTAAALREEAEQARTQIDHLNREKEEFSKEISGSQIKVHLLELHRRLAAAEEKRDNMKNEMNNRLEPQEEREKLLLQVREDNAAIASLDSNAANLKEQIKKVQELIEQAEQDLEEGNSERHQKYRELKKREETMDSFMATYEENLKKEQEKIEQLEKDVVFALEHSSSNIDLDLSEIDNLKQKEGYTSNYDDGKKSIEILMKEYERFQANFKKAEATRQRLATELQTLPEKTQVMKDELITLSDLEQLREKGEEDKKALETELRLLREKLAPTESAVVEATNKLKKLQANLDGNEMYVKLNALEEQLAQLESRKTVLEEDIASITLKADYEPLKKQALEELAALNKKIIEDLNNIKSY